MTTLFLATIAQQPMMNLLGPRLNGGTIEIYDGVQPANANIAVTTQNKLATLTLGSPAFGAADSDGIIIGNAITEDAAATGGVNPATWARFRNSLGGAECDGDAGLSAATVILTALIINAGAKVRISACALQLPDGT